MTTKTIYVIKSLSYYLPKNINYYLFDCLMMCLESVGKHRQQKVKI